MHRQAKYSVQPQQVSQLRRMLQSKLVAFGLFIVGIIGVWAVLNWQLLAKQVSFIVRAGEINSDQQAVLDEMVARYPGYNVVWESRALAFAAGDFAETYQTELFSVRYPHDTFAYNANTSDLSGFGFCPGGRQDCQYPRMVIIPMKTTTLSDWLAQDAEYHTSAYWNLPANKGKYQVAVQPLWLHTSPGILLDVTCQPN